VNAVSPGVVLEGGHPAAGMMTGTPAGRMGTPDEIAAAMVFLCSDDSGFIHGSVRMSTVGELRSRCWRERAATGSRAVHAFGSGVGVVDLLVDAIPAAPKARTGYVERGAALQAPALWATGARLPCTANLWASPTSAPREAWA
jgi:hypothetical protein